jgi:hypothetical protein
MVNNKKKVSEITISETFYRYSINEKTICGWMAF